MAVQGCDQRQRRLLAVDPEDLALAQRQRVAGHELGEPFDPRVPHYRLLRFAVGLPTANGLLTSAAWRLGFISARILTAKT